MFTVASLGNYPKIITVNLLCYVCINMFTVASLGDYSKINTFNLLCYVCINMFTVATLGDYLTINSSSIYSVYFVCNKFMTGLPLFEAKS